MNVLLLAPQPFYEERGTPIAVKWVAENLAALDLVLTQDELEMLDKAGA